MKQLFIFSLILVSLTTKAQDTVVMRDSTRMNVKIIESNDKAIIFSYPNEEIKNEKSKKQIAYIVYSSGRREECKSSIVIPVISGKDDWEKVVVTREKEDVEGLTKVKFISAVGGSIWVTREKAHDSAIEKIKKKAAKLGCGIVLIIEEKYTGKADECCTINGEAFK